MHLILCFLAARALASRRSILYIRSAKDGKYLNLKGDFDDLEKIKHHFQAELETEKGAPPYIKIRDEKNRYLSVKDDTLWWTEEDLGFKWNSSFVETNEGMLSDQNGKCFAREGSQITLKNCNDIINDIETSHFKLIFVPTKEEVRHAQAVLNANHEQSKMLSQDNDGARRGEGGSPYRPLGRPGGDKGMGSRTGISDSLVCPMRGMPDGGPGQYSPGGYGPSGSNPGVPPRGMEDAPQGGLTDRIPPKDRNLDGMYRGYTDRPLEREQGNAGYPYNTQDHFNAAKEEPLSKASGPSDTLSNLIKDFENLKKMLEDKQVEVEIKTNMHEQKKRNDLENTKKRVLEDIKRAIIQLQEENEGKTVSPAAGSSGSSSTQSGPLEDNHNVPPKDNHRVKQERNTMVMEELLQRLQKQVDNMQKTEATTSNLASHGRQAG